MNTSDTTTTASAQPEVAQPCECGKTKAQCQKDTAERYRALYGEYPSTYKP